MKLTPEEIENLMIEYTNSSCTIEELALRSGVSKTTLVRYFSKYKDQLSPELQAAFDDAKNRKWLAAKSTSGNSGHKKYSDNDIINAAKAMVDGGLTLRDLKNGDSDASLSTLYDRFNEETLGRELYAKVVGQYAENIDNRNRRMSISNALRNKANSDINSDASQLSDMMGEASASSSMTKPGKIKR